MSLAVLQVKSLAFFFFYQFKLLLNVESGYLCSATFLTFFPTSRCLWKQWVKRMHFFHLCIFRIWVKIASAYKYDTDFRVTFGVVLAILTHILNTCALLQWQVKRHFFHYFWSYSPFETLSVAGQCQTKHVCDW